MAHTLIAVPIAYYSAFVAGMRLQGIFFGIIVCYLFLILGYNTLLVGINWRQLILEAQERIQKQMQEKADLEKEPTLQHES